MKHLAWIQEGGGRVKVTSTEEAIDSSKHMVTTDDDCPHEYDEPLTTEKW